MNFIDIPTAPADYDRPSVPDRCESNFFSVICAVLDLACALANANPDRKIMAIKALREHYYIGLKDAKDIMDWAYIEVQDEPDQLKAAIARLQAQNERLSLENNRLNGSVMQMQRSVAESESELRIARQELSWAQSDLEAEKAEMARTTDIICGMAFEAKDAESRILGLVDLLIKGNS